MGEHDRPAEDAERSAPVPAGAARSRRRWLTLAELLGVAAVTISALTLWNNYHHRAAEEAEKAAARQQASAASRILLLRGTPDREGTRLTLTPAGADQTIQTQTIRFPADLGLAPVEVISDGRIEAAWFRRPLIRTVRETESRRSDARMPVAITTRFFAGGEAHSETAIYDLGYRLEEGGLLGGHRLRLRGLSRVEAVAPERAQARLDALWRARRPADDGRTQSGSD